MWHESKNIFSFQFDQLNIQGNGKFKLFDDGCAAEEFDAVVVDIALCDDAKEIKDFEKKKDKKNKNKQQDMKFDSVFNWGGWNPRFNQRFNFRG